MSEIKIGRGIGGKWFAGKTRVLKDGTEVWISKSDVTDQIEAITKMKDEKIAQLEQKLKGIAK